jgi:FkbM family methyltransferase
VNILRVLLWPLRNRRPPPPAATAQPAPLPVDASAATASIRHNDIEVVYATPNYATRWRVDTFFDKEPDTLEWIAGFKPQEVLVDVGANVGMYTIWAAMTRAVRVFAFEPESQNYAILYQNIVRNNLSKQVTGFCAALSDESGFSSLYLSEFVAGSSVHTYGAEHDYKLQPRASAITQGCIATTLDHLVATGVVPVPDHIKIDVDGIEHKVLAGCRTVLANPAVKSVLVEINTNLAEHRALIAQLGSAGFSYSMDQVNRYIRKQGAFKGVGNYVFCR